MVEQQSHQQAQAFAHPSLQRLPLLRTVAGPRDANWIDRLKEEYKVLIEYIKLNKEEDSDWF